ncbi:peptidyl-prolyl cis-trans isomerase [Acrasis kona]|uniref:peptidylprolyl isomerase n=1 Tax=Acrasis kona TaxID=1008807 RepID=A0AAW2ZP45_9EUKA
MGVTKEITQNGTGAEVVAGQNVTVHCTGLLLNNTKFWSTHDKNQPFSFQVGVGKVIKGWDEGVIGMKVGEKARLTCSPDYAYGPRGFPAWGIGPNSTLIFEIELLSTQ